MNAQAKARAARQAKEVALLAGLNTAVAEAAKQIGAVHRTVNELAEDNMALLQSLKRSVDGQDTLRTAVVQVVDQTRQQLSGELQFQWLRNCCRELAPVLQAMERMLGADGFADPASTKQHVSSLAITLDGVFRRLGIERMPVREGQDAFDSNLHECIKVCTPADSPIPGAASRTVVFVQEPGYLVQGRLAVPAKVWVQKGDEN